MQEYKFCLVGSGLIWTKGQEGVWVTLVLCPASSFIEEDV